MGIIVWTQENIADLRTLWPQGYSTAEIGRRLGVSKNAVVGKAHRLHLEPRPSPLGKVRTPETCALVETLLRNGMNISRVREIAKCDNNYVKGVYKNLKAERRSSLANTPDMFAAIGVPAWNSKPAVAQITRAAAGGGGKARVIVEPRLRATDKSRIYGPDLEFRHRKPNLGYTAFSTGSPGNRFFQFGKRTERRKPLGNFPTADAIEAFIAQRGVTLCPTAAVAVTTASIAPHDRMEVAAHQAARQAEWAAKHAPRNKRGTEASSRRAALHRIAA